jgi:uncharacterized protein
MPIEPLMTRNRPSFPLRLAVVSYFVLTFAVSWTGALFVAAPHLLRHEPIPKTSGLQMFLVMLLGPSLVGILMTRFSDGEEGLRYLFARMRRVRVRAKWYAVLLLPPALVLTVLLCLRNFRSPIFTPNNLWVGLSFAVVVGWLEEIGWSGYAFPKMSALHGGFLASVLLGVLWGIWHLPVIDYIAMAAPHGGYWFPFFLAFTAAMTAMRVLISWLYANTNSIVLAQLMLAFSTGSLVVFSPARVSAAQEATWYAIYAGALWFIVALLVAANSSRITLWQEEGRVQKMRMQKAGPGRTKEEKINEGHPMGEWTP